MLYKIIPILLAALLSFTVNARADGSASDGSLKQIMQQLGKDYSSLNQAILIKDFESAAGAAHAIAYHDTPSLGQRIKIMAVLRTDMAEFKEADGRVHDLAIQVEKAAKAKDMPSLIKYQSEMFNACMACHTNHRSRVAGLLGD